MSRQHRDPARVALFKKITQTPALCAAFAKFLQLQFADENLLFWQDVQEYKKIAPTDVSKLSKRAKAIVKEYVEDGALREINLNGPTRDGVLAAIGSSQAAVLKDIFQEAEVHIEELMIIDSLPKFTASKIWQETQGFEQKLKLPPCVDEIVGQLESYGELKAEAYIPLDSDRKSAATHLLTTGKSIDASTPPAVVASSLIVWLSLQQFPIVSPELPMFLSFALTASGVEKKERQGQVRALIHSVPVRNQVLLHKILHALATLLKLDKSHSQEVLNYFTPLVFRSKILTNDHSIPAAVLARDTDTLEFLVDNANDFFKAESGSPADKMHIDKMHMMHKMHKMHMMHMYFQDSKDFQSIYRQELIERGFDPTSNAALSERDWSVILSGATSRHYKSGEVVVAQGATNSSIYRVHLGRCEVRRMVGTEEKKMQLLIPGKTYGEISIASTSITTSSLIAAETGATVHEMPTTYLFQLFYGQPDLGSRFCLFIARRLAKNLVSKDSGSQSDFVKRAYSLIEYKKQDTKEAIQDVKFCKQFDLPQDEILVKEYPGSYSKGQQNSHSGTISISQNYLCYFTQVFGLKKKKVIALKDISVPTYVLDGKLGRIQFTEKEKEKEYAFVLDRLYFEEAKALLQSMLVSHQKTSTATSNASKSPSLKRKKKKQKSLNKPTGGELVTKLSEADWNVLLRSSEEATVTYKAGDVIIKQGRHTTKMYQITKGSCRLEINGSSVGQLKAGEIFGDVTFLQGGTATASIIAEEDSTLYCLDTSYLNLLFHADTLLGARFYYYLVTIIAKRILVREKSI